MTPKSKTKFKETAQTRALAVFSSALEGTQRRIESNCYVEGYAARYEPYILYYDNENQPIYACVMSDIGMQHVHQCKVLARTSNGSLLVEVDGQGLFCAADLSRTEAARSCYDVIQAGLVSMMSFRFRLGYYYYDEDTHTIVHRTVAKVYDVAPVSIPANDNTEINARAWVDGEIAQAARREAELDERRRKLRLKIKLTQEAIKK